MKLIHTKSILAGLLAISSAGSLFAGNGPTIPGGTATIRISGAASWRAPITRAVEGVLATGWYGLYYGSGEYSANASIYYGTLNAGASSGTPVVIKIYWTGDLAGAVDLALSESAPVGTSKVLTNWIDNSAFNAATFANTSSPTPTGNHISNGGNVTSWVNESSSSSGSPVDGAVTVSNASSSAAILSSTGSGGTASAAITSAISNGYLTEAGVAIANAGAPGEGIAAFEFAIGNYDTSFVTTGAPFTNITSQQARTLLAGPTPLPFFTGSNGTTRSTADTTKWVFLIGRSEDAGARTIPFAEVQNGVEGSAVGAFGYSTFQYQLTFTGSTTTQIDNLPTGGAGSTVSGLFPWPASWPLNTEPTISWSSTGHGGYNLTGDVINALTAKNPVVASSITQGGSNTGGAFPGTHFNYQGPTSANSPGGINEYWFVGYSQSADVEKFVATGGINAQKLTYNGVAFSPAAVANGQYSLWSYAHLFYLNDKVSGVKQNTLDAIADAVYTNYAATDKSGNVYTPPTVNVLATGINISYGSLTGALPILAFRALEGDTLQIGPLIGTGLY